MRSLIKSGARPALLLATFFLLCLPMAGALAQAEMSYAQYRALAWASDRLDHVAMFEPVHGEAGMFLVIAERFGTVQVVKLGTHGAERVWKSNQLSGVPDEVLTADLDGDGLEDAFICRTNTGKIYVWDMDNYTQVWESLPNDYKVISCMTTANIDDDQENEIVMLADNRLVYINGLSFSKDFSSVNEYQATMIRCGDVDGDGSVEIVLNSGQVIDSVSGNVEWEEELFYKNIELLDIDGDGMPEVLTEDGGSGPLKVYDMDYGNEVRFQ